MVRMDPARSIFRYSRSNTTKESNRRNTVMPNKTKTEKEVFSETVSPTGQMSPDVSPRDCKAPSQVVTGQIPTVPTSSRESQQKGQGESLHVFGAGCTPEQWEIPDRSLLTVVSKNKMIHVGVALFYINLEIDVAEVPIAIHNYAAHNPYVSLSGTFHRRRCSPRSC